MESCQCRRRRSKRNRRSGNRSKAGDLHRSHQKRLHARREGGGGSRHQTFSKRATPIDRGCGGADQMTSTDREKLLARIKALFSKTTEAGATEAEELAAAEKHRELIEKDKL